MGHKVGFVLGLLFWVGAFIVGLVFNWPVLWGFISFAAGLTIIMIVAKVLYRRIKLRLSWRATFIGEKSEN